MKSVSASIVILALAVVGARAADVASVDWPQWRGPHRDDVSTETGLLKQWPAGGPKLLWKGEGIGRGYSSVSIASGKIFTMGDKGDSSYVYALTADGKPAWNAKVGKPGGEYPGTRCTPTVDGAVVYALGQFGDLVCLKVADGTEVWRKSFSKDFAAGPMPHWAFAESPLVDGEMLICTPGGPKGTMIALNKKTGEPVWQSAEVKDSAAYSSVIPADISGVHQYIQLTQASVFGVDAKSGKLLWRAPRKGSTAVIPTPIYFDNHVFVASGYNIGCNCFKITAAGGAFKAEQVYSSPEMVNHHGGVIRIGENVYGHSDNGGWTCLEMKTGTIKWKDKGIGKGSMTFADGMFYLRKEDGPGTIALIEASPEGYKEHGRFPQPDRSNVNSWPHPVVCDGKLYIRDQDVLLCYDVKNN